MEACFIALVVMAAFLAMASSNGSTIVRDYHCEECNPDHYVSMSTEVPVCDNCGQYMREFRDE